MNLCITTTNTQQPSLSDRSSVQGKNGGRSCGNCQCGARVVGSHGSRGERDAVQSRRRQRLERPRRQRRAVQLVGRQDEVPDRRPAAVRVPEGDGRGGGGGSGGVRRVQHVVAGRRRRRKVQRRQHGVHVRQVGALLLHQRQRGQLPRRREARRRRHGRPHRPPHAAAAGCADAEPGVVATVACASRRHPELGAVSGSYDAEPIAVGFTYGAGACSDDVNTELATGASSHGTVAVNYPWRRGPATAAAGDRWGERDDAGGARSQRPEWRRRRRSGGGRRRRHVAGSVHRLRHGSYLKLSASAVTCSFICAV